MLKGVVTNKHCLAKFSREAFLTPYLGHAHYIYACYLKGQILSRHPPADCNWESVSGRVEQGYAQGLRLGSFTFSDPQDPSGTPECRIWNACELLLLRRVFGICRGCSHLVRYHQRSSFPHLRLTKDPNRAPHVVAPSTPLPPEEEAPSIPELPSLSRRVEAHFLKHQQLVLQEKSKPKMAQPDTITAI